MSEACPAKLQEAPVSRDMTQADIAGCEAQFAWMCRIPSASTSSAKYTRLGEDGEAEGERPRIADRPRDQARQRPEVAAGSCGRRSAHSPGSSGQEKRNGT